MKLKISLFTKIQYGTVLFLILLQSSIDAEAVEKIKRQNLIPSARIGRELFFTDEDTPVELPSSFEENIDFSSSEPSYIDSEVFLSTESDSENIGEDFSNEQAVTRKKRSLSEIQSTERKTGSQKPSENMKSNWNTEMKNNFLKTEKRRPRNKLVFIPRIGKKSYDEEMSYANKRAVFIPRIGKKSFDDIELVEDKRAVFIPRIGKKSYRNNDSSDAKRAVFIPRIGRGSAFVPKAASNNPQYRVRGRVVFIPRIG